MFNDEIIELAKKLDDVNVTTNETAQQLSELVSKQITSLKEINAITVKNHLERSNNLWNLAVDELNRQGILWLKKDAFKKIVTRRADEDFKRFLPKSFLE